ncbi:hypothetical protein D3C75_879320 [compost metagenome]
MAAVRLGDKLAYLHGDGKIIDFAVLGFHPVEEVAIHTFDVGAILVNKIIQRNKGAGVHNFFNRCVRNQHLGIVPGGNHRADFGLQIANQKLQFKVDARLVLKNLAQRGLVGIHILGACHSVKDRVRNLVLGGGSLSGCGGTGGRLVRLIAFGAGCCQRGQHHSC